LKLNLNKTNVIEFKTISKLTSNSNLNNVTDLNPKNTVKLLEIVIDQNLQWKKHIEYIVKKTQ
jgi:hypothetical protein